MKKVSSMIAQNAFCRGKKIVLCPSNCAVESMFALSFTPEECLYADRVKEYRRLINSFYYYNCMDKETIHYYVEE